MENTYDLMVLLSPALDEPAQTKTIDILKVLIGKNGSIISEQKIGKKTLAYPVKKQKEGIYWNFKLKLTTLDIKGLINKINLEGTILRHLLVESGKA
jgi:small subunit ribosomal protein S6